MSVNPLKATAAGWLFVALGHTVSHRSADSHILNFPAILRIRRFRPKTGRRILNFVSFLVWRLPVGPLGGSRDRCSS